MVGDELHVIAVNKASPFKSRTPVLGDERVPPLNAEFPFTVSVCWTPAAWLNVPDVTTRPFTTTSEVSVTDPDFAISSVHAIVDGPLNVTAPDPSKRSVPEPSIEPTPEQEPATLLIPEPSDNTPSTVIPAAPLTSSTPVTVSDAPASTVKESWTVTEPVAVSDASASTDREDWTVTEPVAVTVRP